MPATATLGLRYPSAADLVQDTPLHLQHLADDVEAALRGSTTDALLRTLKATATNAGAVVSIVKGAPAHATNLQEWQNSSGTPLASVDQYGRVSGGSLHAGGASNPGLAYLSVVAPSNVLPMLVRAVAGQTTNLQEWQDNAGTQLLKVTAAGQIISGSNNAGLHVGEYSAGTFGDGPGVLRANTDLYLTAPGGTLSIFQPVRLTAGQGYFYPEVASQVVMAARGAAAQTADLQQWQNSSGTALAKITSAGVLDAADIKVSGGSTSRGTQSRFSFATVPTDIGAAADYCSVTFTPVQNRLYRIKAVMVGSQITATGTPVVQIQKDGVAVFNLLSGEALTVGQDRSRIGEHLHRDTAGSPASTTFKIRGSDTAGAFRVTQLNLTVEDVGI